MFNRKQATQWRYIWVSMTRYTHCEVIMKLDPSWGRMFISEFIPIGLVRSYRFTMCVFRVSSCHWYESYRCFSCCGLQVQKFMLPSFPVNNCIIYCHSLLPRLRNILNPLLYVIYCTCISYWGTHFLKFWKDLKMWHCYI